MLTVHIPRRFANPRGRRVLCILEKTGKPHYYRAHREWRKASRHPQTGELIIEGVGPWVERGQ